MKENYIPSQNEQAMAEDMMTRGEANLSKDREKMMNELEKEGKTGYLEIKRSKDFPGVSRLQGIINGHNVDIWQGYKYNERPGKIDGKEISQEETDAIFKKYEKIAINSADLEDVANEDKQLEAAIKDLL